MQRVVGCIHKRPYPHPLHTVSVALLLFLAQSHFCRQCSFVLVAMDRRPSCSRKAANAWVRGCLLVVLLLAATPHGAEASWWSGKHKVAVSTTSTHTLHAPEVGRIVDWLHRVVDMEPRLRSDMVRVEHVLRDTTRDLAESAREASNMLKEVASKAQTSAQEIMSLAQQTHNLAAHVADTAFRVSVFITVFVTGSAMALLATWNGAPVAEVLNRLWLLGVCGSAALVLARVLAGPLFIDDWALAALGIFPVLLSMYVRYVSCCVFYTVHLTWLLRPTLYTSLRTRTRVGSAVQQNRGFPRTLRCRHGAC